MNFNNKNKEKEYFSDNAARRFSSLSSSVKSTIKCAPFVIGSSLLCLFLLGALLIPDEEE